MEEVGGFFGSLGLSAAMTLVMLVVFRFIPESAPDRWKTLTVVVLGILLSVVWQLYRGVGLSFVCVVDCFFYGIQLGATSIGLFKVGQATGVFRNAKGGG